MEPSQELPQILERCRAHGIACPIDLVTARQPTTATLAWLDYVRELPLPEAPALADGVALTGFAAATFAAQQEPIVAIEDVMLEPDFVPVRSEPSAATEAAWLEDERERELARLAVARNVAENQKRARERAARSPRLFVWLLAGALLLAGLGGAWLTWQHAQPLAAQAPVSEMAIGFAFLEQHKPERAAAIFRSLLQREPQRADAHYGLARVYFEQGKEEDALSEAQAALKQRENDPDTWLMLANASQRSGHLTLARQAYARTLALAPRHPHAEEIRAALRELDGQ